MSKDGLVIFASVLLVIAAFAMPSFADDHEGGNSIHPYPLYPFATVPGRPGFGAPEIQPHYEAWRAALDEGDEEWAAEIIGQFRSEHFLHGYPQFLPYPGSIEHVRADWQRYVPPYPIYNHHTLAANFILHEYGQTRDACETFIEPLYWFSQWNIRYVTNATRELPAYPWRPGESIEISIGQLTPRRMYAVRVIGALKPEDVVRFTTVANPERPIDPSGAEKQLVFQFEINDRPDGGVSTYIIRGRAWDQFYETVACHWDVIDEREFNIRITLLEESEATLYTYNIDAHNIFGANAQRPGKQRSTTFDTESRRERWADRRVLIDDLRADGDRVIGNLRNYHSRLLGRQIGNDTDSLIAAIEREPMAPEERARRDEDIWRSLPPFNFTIDSWPGGAVGHEKVRGDWDIPARNLRDASWDEPWHLVRRDAGGNIIDTYTWEDMVAYKPLPGTEDRGYGVKLDEPLNDRRVVSYIASMHWERTRWQGNLSEGWQGNRLGELMRMYDAVGDEHVARDAAILLARYVHSYPSMHGVKFLQYVESKPPYVRGIIGRGGRYRPGAWNLVDLDVFLVYYDQLFDYLKDNQELADALGRFIPWIETPEDVRFLFEVYGLQYNANEYMHSQMVTGAGEAPAIARLALVQNDNEITRPWMEHMFARTFQYPQNIAGVDDIVVTSVTRDGAHNIGSWSYAGALGLEMAGMTGDYVAQGGDPKYDLGDFSVYPKSLSGAWWPLESRVGGGFYPGIGDVGGPARPRDYGWNAGFARHSWQLTGDPRFAWYIANNLGRETESDEEWRAIVDAADNVELDPRLTQRSRVLSDWFAVLEGGVGNPDYRFLQAAALNVGDSGSGHSHDDTFDLRIWALGQNMAGDMGQRQQYGRPRHNSAFSHNLVEVDGDGRDWTASRGRWDGYAWVSNLFDAPGAHYMYAEATPPRNHPGVNFHRRHVALINADEGAPGQGQEAVLPSVYVMDIVRVSGGNRHTYSFGGSVDDNHVADGGFEINVVNRRTVTPGEDTPEGQYLRNFRWARFAEDYFGEPVKELDREWAADPAEETLIATWRRSLGAGGMGTGGRRYMRMHLLNVGDHRVLHAINTDINGANRLNPDVAHYSARMIYTQKDSDERMESVYVALLEPFEGEPTITSSRLLDVADNETDALRAAAVEVRTANGRSDLLFSDGRPQTARLVESPLGGDPVRILGEYAYLSFDDDGLRQAALTGGDHIVAPGIELRLSVPEYRGVVRSVDYLNRMAVVTGLPSEPELAGLFFEIGNDKHRTSFEVDEISLDEAGNTTIRLRKGIEIMRGTVTAADYETGVVTTNVAMRHLRGRDDGLTASSIDPDSRWSARFEGGNRFDGFNFRLEGRPITADDFPVGGKLSVWEFGEGDEVAMKAGASLRRVGEDVWQVYANAPFTVDLDGAALEWSADGQAWHDVEAGEELGPGRGQPRGFMLRVR